MKKFRYIVMAVTAAVVLAFVSCKKDNEKPSINVMDEGEKWSVSAILDSLGKVETFLFDEYEPASVDAYVIGDERTGNIYRTIYIRDEKGGCIAVYRNSGTEDFQAHAGDYITLRLSGAVAGYYNGLPQIQLPAAGVEPDPNVRIIIRQRNVDIIPTPATLKEVNEGKHLCDLVKLSDVQFSDPNHTYAEYESSSDRGIEDCSGYSAVVRTSNYATFASDSLPKGKGDLVCVVSLYKKSESNKTWQMLIRNTSDVNMNGPRCEDEGETVKELPYNQSFSTTFGTYKPYDCLGAQTWEIDYSTAKMTGYVDNTNYANEDWLISSQVALTGVENAKVCINYIARYFQNINNDISLMVSRDYVSGTDPKEYDWTKLDVEFVNGSDWNTFITSEVSLKDFVGDTVVVAVRYLSTEVKAGTIEVKYIEICEGEPAEPGTSDELQELPYEQDFSYSFGTYDTYDVFGDEYWTIDYHTAKMTGYVGNTNHANDDWLLSSSVNLKDAASVTAEITYIGRYFANINNDMHIFVSDDYERGKNPNDYTWTEISGQWSESSDWNTFKTLTVDLSAFAGKEVVFAVEYTSTDTKAGTIEIKSIVIKENETGK